MTLKWTVLGMLAVAGCSESSEVKVGAEPSALTARCLGEAPGWVCGEDREVACEPGGVDLITIEVDTGEAACDPFAFELNTEGPFGPGTHDIVVSSRSEVDGVEVVEETCRSVLTVVDDTPPTVTANTLTVWPPNHKWHTFSAADLVQIEDDCSSAADLRIEVLGATSDEPFEVNRGGDGNHQDDLQVDCDGVRVRAERQGGSNGRVYTVAWRVSDMAGNAVDGNTQIVVTHDQSGRDAIDDGPAVEVPAVCN